MKISRLRPGGAEQRPAWKTQEKAFNELPR
jgi:hypothetical protein